MRLQRGPDIPLDPRTPRRVHPANPAPPPSGKPPARHPARRTVAIATRQGPRPVPLPTRAAFPTGPLAHPPCPVRPRPNHPAGGCDGGVRYGRVRVFLKQTPHPRIHDRLSLHSHFLIRKAEEVARHEGTTVIRVSRWILISERSEGGRSRILTGPPLSG